MVIHLNILIRALRYHLSSFNKATNTQLFGGTRVVDSKTKWRRDNKYIPVLVEATTALFGQMLSPNINQGTQTEWSFNVANGTNNNHWWSFQNGNGFNNLLLVNLYNVGIQKKRDLLETCT